VGLIPLLFENLSNEDLGYLEKNVEDLERTPEEQIEAITELDLAFHKKLCLISGNSLIIRVNQILSDLFKKSMQDVVVALGNQTGRVYHRKIFEAMRRGDQKLTAAILEEHIENTIHSIRQATLWQESGIT
jgi:GntR family transcriptional repressor for pyruvate dehydrogenase complex